MHMAEERSLESILQDIRSTQECGAPEPSRAAELSRPASKRVKEPSRQPEPPPRQ